MPISDLVIKARLSSTESTVMGELYHGATDNILSQAEKNTKEIWKNIAKNSKLEQPENDCLSKGYKYL